MRTLRTMTPRIHWHGGEAHVHPSAMERGHIHHGPDHENRAPAWYRPRWRQRLGYWLSWVRAEGVGLTVCRVLGHRQPEPELVEFQRWLLKVWNRPVDDEFYQPACTRCGAVLEEAKDGG